jgi:hypothetical protein
MLLQHWRSFHYLSGNRRVGSSPTHARSVMAELVYAVTVAGSNPAPALGGIAQVVRALHF